jgi:hypothetical protein
MQICYLVCSFKSGMIKQSYLDLYEIMGNHSCIKRLRTHDASSLSWFHHRVPTNEMSFVFSYKPLLVLHLFIGQFSSNTKKCITSKGLQTCSQRKNTEKCHECPLELGDTMTEYMTDLHLALGTTQYTLNWAHPYRQMLRVSHWQHLAIHKITNTNSNLRQHLYTLNIHLNECNLPSSHAPIQDLLIV